jgi:hypothetical protein
MAYQSIICGAKQVSLQLLASGAGVGDVGAVFALDDAVCTNLTNILNLVLSRVCSDLAFILYCVVGVHSVRV